MPTQSANANTSLDGIPTSAYYEDRGDGTSDWLHKVRVHNGGDVTQGLTTNAAVTDPTSTATVVSLLKGLLTFLRISAAGLGKAEDAVHASGDTGTMPLSVRRDAPTAGAGTDGDYQALSTDALGQLRVARERASTATITTVADNAVSVQLLAAATSRRGVTIVNTSSAILHIALGATAVIATARTASIAASGGEWTMPDPVYTGVINGIWATDPGDGVAIITQLT